MLQRAVRHCFSTPKKTCLYDVLVESKGKIVDFAGTPSSLLQDTLSLFSSHKESSRNTCTVDKTHLFSMSATWAKSSSPAQTVLSFWKGPQSVQHKVTKIIIKENPKTESTNAT